MRAVVTEAPTTVRSAKRPSIEGEQDDHGTTADHRGACEADARQSVYGSAVASGRRRPSYLRVGTVYRYPIGAVEAWIAESVRGNIAS